MSLFKELKRRNVFRVAIAYIVVAWLLLQVSDTLIPALYLPEWFQSGVAFVLILGFPLAMLLAWAFELTPDGIKREIHVDRSSSITSVTGRKLDFAIIGLLLMAVVYFSIDKFGQKLDDVESITETVISDTSIAVIPFVNMSDDASNEFFADGITEELLNLLAKIPELQVTSRSSAFTFKGRNVDIPTIAAQLNVAHVLEGSVRKAGNTVRITAQLINAEDDAHMWSETYDRELDDIFAIQDEIAKNVVAVLHVTLLGRAPESTVTDAEAYSFYLQAIYFVDIYDNANAQQAVESALQIDPDYAPAWALLGRILRDRANVGSLDLHEGTESARRAVMRALELDENSADAKAMLASLQHVYDWNWDAASRTIGEALAIEPGNARVLTEAVAVARTQGDLGAAIDFANRALERDPLNVRKLDDYGHILWASHNYEMSEKALRKAIHLHPGTPGVNADLVYSLLGQRKYEEALHHAMQEENVLGRARVLPIIYARLGRRDEADEALANVIAEHGNVLAFQIAEIYADDGMIDEAFEWLNISIETRDGGITHLPYDPLLESLHDDPRWLETLERVDLADAWRRAESYIRQRDESAAASL